MNLHISHANGVIIGITDTTSDDITFTKLTKDDITTVLKHIVADREGKRNTLWSDNDFEEPNSICYAYYDGSTFIEIHEVRKLLIAIANNKELYMIEVEYYI